MLSPLRTDPGDLQQAEAVDRWCRSWINSESLAKLFSLFGGPDPTSLTRAQLVEFSAQNWDFRRRSGVSVERNQIDSVLAPRLAGQVIEAAADLGLASRTELAAAAYDLVLILGGLVRACLQRPMLAAVLLSDVKADQVFGLGGFRPLVGNERDLLAGVGLVDIDNEVDAMCRGVELAFGVNSFVDVGSDQSVTGNESWLIRRYDETSFDQLGVVAAPSLMPAERRANTPDTYKFMAEHVSQLNEMSRVLIVTSAIYAPYQNLAAHDILGREFGCGIETVGTLPTDAVSGIPVQEFSASHYLQEVNSTLRSIDMWYDGIG